MTLHINMETNIPWYRTRRFWGIIYFLFFCYSTFIFLQLSDKNGGDFNRTINQVYDFIVLSYGSGFFYLLAQELLGTLGKYIGPLIYLVTISFLVFKTFKTNTTKLTYPIIVSLLYITGIVTAMLFMSGM